LLALLFFPLSLLAQVFPVDPASGKIVYSEEVLVMDGPKTDLYNRARAWLMANNISKQVLPVDDLNNGLLLATNYSLLLIPEGNKNHTYKLWHTIKIEVENDRFWYRISQFQLQKSDSLPTARAKDGPAGKQALEAFVFSKAGSGNKVYQHPLPQALTAKVQESIAALIKDLKANML
jgi:hypothetical protein